jgi:RNA polymerase sigma-70 factor (ECF subfamily)
LTVLVLEAREMADCAPQDIDELLRQARCGDERAAEELLNRHRARLRGMVALRLDARLLARVDPSDVVQDTLVIACQRLPDYLRASPMPFYPWLRSLAWQRLVDLHRQHVRAQRRTVSREEPLGIGDESAGRLADHLAASGAGGLRILISAEVVDRVRSALGRLSAADRQMLLLRHLEQLRLVDCAAVMAISETAAKKRYLRALERLGRHLAGLGREYPP